jgi:hypothetical protein
MNNARHLREFDFSNIYHASRIKGFFQIVDRKKLAMAASTIRYRKPLRMFSLYKVIANLQKCSKY